MSSWITVYCRRSVAAITPKQLLSGLRDGDPDAPAGVDYLTLAEDYGVDEALVLPKKLRVTGDATSYSVACGGARAIRVHRWTDAARVKTELAELLEIRKVKPRIAQRLQATVEIIAIELSASQTKDFAVVVAYEVARYLAQRGDGVIVDLEAKLTHVPDGGFSDL